MAEHIEIFDKKAEIYLKNRPRYPDELIKFLYKELRISSETKIADIGCGTGILTEKFLLRGSNVVGVEPNNDMRIAAKQFLSQYPNFAITSGTAENTYLDDQSIDLITVAQAFHWFDMKGFKNECYRISRNKPCIALIWNKKTDNIEMEHERQKIRNSVSAVKDIYNNNWIDRLKGIDLFFGSRYRFKEFDNNIINDYDTFIGRSLSDSRAPKENDPLYDIYINKLTEYFERYSDKNGILTVPNKTILYYGELCER